MSALTALLSMPLPRTVAQKGNPCHDKTGAFTSKERASTGSTGGTGGTGSKEVPSPKGKLVKASEEERKKMSDYMTGFTKGLKNEQERKYAEERVRQMVAGEDRPTGMSGKFGLTKNRAIQYEMLIYKIFLAGRKKHNV